MAFTLEQWEKANGDHCYIKCFGMINLLKMLSTV